MKTAERQNHSRMNLRNRISDTIMRVFRSAGSKLVVEPSSPPSEADLEPLPPEPDQGDYDPRLNVSLVQFIQDSEAPVRLKNAFLLADEADMLPHQTLGEYFNNRFTAYKTYCEMPQFSGLLVFDLECLLNNQFRQLQPDKNESDLIESSLNQTPSIEPCSWSEIVNQIENHTNLADQYISLTAQVLDLPWPSDLLYLQLKDLQNLTESNIENLLGPLNEDSNGIEAIQTLKSVLSFWDDPKNQQRVDELNPEFLIRQTVERHIPNVAAQVVYRRLDSVSSPKETAEAIGQSLGLSRDYIRQFETKAVRRLNQPPFSDCLKILLYSCQEQIENYLLGVNGCVRKNALPKCLDDPTLTKSLAIRVLYSTVAGYADANFVCFRNLYFKANTDESVLKQNFERIESSIQKLSLPLHIEVVAAELNVSVHALVCYAASNVSHGIFDDYLYEGRMTPRKQRGIQLMKVISGCLGGGPATFAEIISTYRYVFPNDKSSIRDLRNSMYEYSDQILPLTDNGFASIMRFCSIQDSVGVSGELIPELDHAEYGSFNPGTLYAEIVDLVDEIGPAPLLEIRSEFSQRFSEKWSANSVFPVLKSTNYFVRMAPGIIGTLPMAEDAAKLDILPALESEIQVKYYIYAKVSHSRFDYPLWNPDVEFHWCDFGDGNLPWETYASLLSVVNPDQWPISEEHRGKWHDRIAEEGKFMLTVKPLPLTQILPTVRDICTLALFIGDHSTVSWLDINRVLGYRIDSRSSMSFLAILAKLGIIEITKSWLLPIQVRRGAAYRFLNEIVCSNRLNSLWLDVPELMDTKSSMKSIWINQQELEQMLTLMRTVSTADESTLYQPTIFDDFEPENEIS